jgi:hypothetical protein
MFLDILTNDDEKVFFLNFAYLIAVAEGVSDQSNLITCSEEEDPKKGKYHFPGFVPGFEMEKDEFLMLRKFAFEIGIIWYPLFSYSNAPSGRNWNLGRMSELPDSTRKILSVKSSILFNSYSDQFWSANSVLDILDKFHNFTTENRLDLLKIAFAAITSFIDPNLFAIEKKKAILMVGTAMAYADGNLSKLEKNLLEFFCSICGLDIEFMNDFISIAGQLASLYNKAFELVTE